MKIHFLKTVWSDMILLQTNDKLALIDTGFEEQYPQLEEYIHTLGFTSIEFILLTHFHRDHYGSIPKLLEHFQVGTVYLKEYSGLDCTTAWGSAADDAYRESETQKYINMQKIIAEKSELVQAENVKSIEFDGHTLSLYSTADSIQKIYEDENYPETYHKIAFSENQNSLAAFMKVNETNLFFGGDILDLPASHPLADCVNYQIAKEIGEEIHIYKVPHHATYNTGLPKTLEIYRPKIAVITNEADYVTNHSDALSNLQNANPDVQICFTEKENLIFEIEE